MYFQIIIAIFAIFALYRVIAQFLKHRITRNELFFWIIFWILVLAVGTFPSIINYIANIVGIGRGVDVAIYLSILIIFYLLFKVFVRLDRIDKDLTKIVRKISLSDSNKSEKNLTDKL